MRNYIVKPPNKRLLALLKNYIAREKFVLQEMEAKRVVDTAWHNMNQKCFIKGMEYALKIMETPKNYETTWIPDGKLLTSQTRKEKI